MPYAKIENGIVIYPPINDGSRFNVHLDAMYCEDHGFTLKTPEEIAAYEAEHAVSVDRAALEAAYANFRAVCSAIGMLIGKPEFKGGFDEISDFSSSESAKTGDGILLAVQWLAADKQCTYEAAMLGIGQPQWWNECWDIQ